MRAVDLNSDLGEGAGTEPELMPLITSANIACAAHAGDERTMRDAVRLAREHGAAVGAHPGYRDRENFGRSALTVPADELARDIAVQIAALGAVAAAEGVPLAHVKVHGALYNTAQHDPAVAGAIVAAVRDTDPALLLFVFPGSALERAARAAGLAVAREGFIDRTYEPDGTLRSRRLDGALVLDPAAAARQAVAFLRDGGVRAADGTFLALPVDTLCVHGDTPGAPAIVRAARTALVAAGATIAAPRR